MSDHITREFMVNKHEYQLAAKKLTAEFMKRKYLPVVIEAAEHIPERFFYMLDMIGADMRLADTELKISDEKSWQAKMAMRLGGLAGYMIANEVYDEDFSDDDVFGDGLKLETVYSDSMDGARKLAWHSFHSFALSGYSLLGDETVEVVDGWMDDMVRERNSQPYFVTGLGIVINNSALNFFTVMDARKSVEFKGLEGGIGADEFNWDQVLADTTDN